MKFTVKPFMTFNGLFYFLKIYFYFMIMSVLLACIYVHHVCSVCGSKKRNLSSHSFMIFVVTKYKTGEENQNPHDPTRL